MKELYLSAFEKRHYVRAEEIQKNWKDVEAKIKKHKNKKPEAERELFSSKSLEISRAYYLMWVRAVLFVAVFIFILFFKAQLRACLAPSPTREKKLA